MYFDLQISPPPPLYSIPVCKKICRNLYDIFVTGIGQVVHFDLLSDRDTDWADCIALSVYMDDKNCNNLKYRQTDRQTDRTDYIALTI